jgi:uncharacterized membrane protein YgcG
MRSIHKSLFLGLVVWLSAVTAVWAHVGTVTHISGVLVAHRPSGETILLAPHSPVEVGDVLVSEANSFARIRFNDGGDLLVRPHSRITIKQYRYNRKRPERDAVSLNLVQGGMRVITGAVGRRNPGKHHVTTPTATVGIRGTDFGLQQCSGDCAGLRDNSGNPLPDGLHIDVQSGTIFAVNAAGSIDISAGQFGFVGDSQTMPAIAPEPQGFLVSVPPNMTDPDESDNPLDPGGDGGVQGSDTNENSSDSGSGSDDSSDSSGGDDGGGDSGDSSVPMTSRYATIFSGFL